MTMAMTQTTDLNATARNATRRRLAVPARLTWKDANGAVRFASVTTRDVSASGAFVECSSQAPIPLFRLVHLQLEAGEAVAAGAGSRVLAAVWRVERPAANAGCPSGYALRFMVDPAQAAQPVPHEGLADMAVAS
jgi:hypothetical protein